MRISNSLLHKKEVQIEINKVYVESIEFLQEPTIISNTVIYTHSPIVVYSTLFTKDNRKKTYYYSPYEEEFSDLITKNLIKKFMLLNKGYMIRY
ncbi:MAG: CRISPR-associated endoribonuclease Cas6 [Candidatus Nitrosocaldaceae archaeon]